MKKIFLIISVSFLLTACGNGFEPTGNQDPSNYSSSCLGMCDESEDSHDSDEDNSNQIGGLPSMPNFELDGKVSGGIWNGSELLKLDLAKQELLVRVPVDFGVDVVAGTFPVPGKEGLNLEFVTDANSSKHLQLRIPLRKLIKKDLLINEMGLPNGDPLPMVSGGKLPHISTQVTKTTVHFYTGKGTVALFVPTNFNPYITLVFPIKNKNKEVLGHFATIAEKSGFKGGFYASIQLPDKLLKAIDTWLPLAQ